MKFYSERVKIAQIPNGFLYRKGAFLERLVGVNTHQHDEDIDLQPIYVPLLRFEKKGSIVFIDVSWDTPMFTVVLMPTFPFVQIVEAGEIYIEDL